MANILFVYGTLMKGMRNHVYLEKAKFLEAAETNSEYELMYNGSIPAARAGNEPIKGELYEVDDETLASLDVLEEVSSRLYEKKEAKIGDKQAIIYLGGTIFDTDTWEKIPDGDYRKLIEAQQKTA
ncbi:MAG: gamma-glutamylcyclotransferase family protein [Patescibacteria group bacterium]